MIAYSSLLSKMINHPISQEKDIQGLGEDIAKVFENSSCERIVVDVRIHLSLDDCNGNLNALHSIHPSHISGLTA